MKTTREIDLLGCEWSVLHRDHERAERDALLIKLAAVAVAVLALAVGFDGMSAMLVLAVLWLQEAILRGGQAWLMRRLLHVEALLRHSDPAPGQACQLYTNWSADRPAAVPLVGQYLSHAVRPTVAFIYVALIVLVAAYAPGT